MRFTPHNYQARAIQFILCHPKSALFLDLGLGKTVSTLTAVKRLQDCLEISRVLVIAPLSVARNTWTAECVKWDHLIGMRVSVVLGSERQRRAALSEDADLYVINRENTEWLCNELDGDLSLAFDMIVIDESSSFKSHSSKRFKALRKAAAGIDRMVLLTGTPSPNGYQDLWAQFRILDGGERLGATWTGFLQCFFHPLFGSGHVVYKYGLNKGAAEMITKRIQDITVSMRAEDYLTLPDAATIDHPVTFSDALMESYHKFKRDLVLDLDGQPLTAETAVALSNKLHQFTGGAVYDEWHMVHDVHTEKLQTLRDLVEAARVSGENVLVFYQYRHEMQRLSDTLKEWKPEFFRGEPEILKRWNDGNIRVLLAHPASISYGLNMQHGGHVIIWYSLTWSLEQYQQANARLHRQGQSVPVRIYRLIAAGTVDEIVAAALSGKADLQDALLSDLRNDKTP